MTTREEVRAAVRGRMITGGDCDASHNAAQERYIESIVQALMSLPALRLAEKAEEMNAKRTFNKVRLVLVENGVHETYKNCGEHFELIESRDDVRIIEEVQ